MGILLCSGNVTTISVVPLPMLQFTPRIEKLETLNALGFPARFPFIRLLISVKHLKKDVLNSENISKMFKTGS
jgi:hypothetical protein